MKKFILITTSVFLALFPLIAGGFLLLFLIKIMTLYVIPLATKAVLFEYQHHFSKVHTLFFLILFAIGSGTFILNNFFAILMFPLRCIITVIKGLFRLIFIRTPQIRFGFFPFLKAYIFHLKQAIQKENIWEIVKSISLFWWGVTLWRFPKNHKELALVETPLEQRNLIINLNQYLQKIDIGVYITYFTSNERKSYFEFYVTEAGKSYDFLAQKLNKMEIKRILPRFSSEWNIEILPSRNYTIIKATQCVEWIFETPNLESIIPQKDSLVLGRELHKNGEYKEVQININNLLHVFISGLTRSGKDILTNNVLYSLVHHILVKNEPYSVFYFDTKGNDGSMLDDLSSKEIYRIKKHAFVSTIQKLLQDMSARMEKIGRCANFKEYNKQNPQTPIKRRFIVINEILSLFADKELEKPMGEALIRLAAEGAAAGFHLILIGQSSRRDISDYISRILVNIDSCFAFRVSSKMEAQIIGRDLQEDDREKLLSIGTHRCLLIQNGKIIQEVKPYLITPQILGTWIDNEGYRDEPKEGLTFCKRETLQLADIIAKAMRENVLKLAWYEEFQIGERLMRAFIAFCLKEKLAEKLPSNAIIWKEQNKERCINCLARFEQENDY